MEIISLLFAIFNITTSKILHANILQYFKCISLPISCGLVFCSFVHNGIQQQLNTISTAINSKTPKYCSWKTIRPLWDTLGKNIDLMELRFGVGKFCFVSGRETALAVIKADSNQLQSTSASDLASPWCCSDILVMISVDQPSVSSWGLLGYPISQSALLKIWKWGIPSRSCCSQVLPSLNSLGRPYISASTDTLHKCISLCPRQRYGTSHRFQACDWNSQLHGFSGQRGCCTDLIRANA